MAFRCSRESPLFKVAYGLWPLSLHLPPNQAPCGRGPFGKQRFHQELASHYFGRRRMARSGRATRACVCPSAEEWLDRHRGSAYNTFATTTELVGAGQFGLPSISSVHNSMVVAIAGAVDGMPDSVVWRSCSNSRRASERSSSVFQARERRNWRRQPETCRGNQFAAAGGLAADDQATIA